MYALLMREPWNMPRESIARLTDWQKVNLIFRPGDPHEAKQGVYWPVPDYDPERACDPEGMPRPRVGEVKGSSFHEVVYWYYRTYCGMRDRAAMRERLHQDYPDYRGLDGIDNGDGTASYPGAENGR